jgi:leucyl/phenylalanyl-tRNA---protein transferase
MPVLLYKNNFQAFPPAYTADADGLLALSLDLHYERVIAAYEKGIFPWFEDWDYFYWYTPPQRCVLYPKDIVISKSMRSYFNQNKLRVSFDTCFEEIIKKCAETKRSYGDGTWINSHFIESYTLLHELGYAHSVEVWQENKLVGGLYGLAFGKVFSGESMFSSVPNASKFALISLAQQLLERKFLAIDCQQTTNHLQTMGASVISRDKYIKILEKNMGNVNLEKSWSDWGS